VILLDLRMPEINGHVFLRDLNRQFVDVPVIVISGEGGMNDVILAMRNQAADYLQKPFKADELSRALDRVLRGPATGGSQAGEGDLATSPRSASTQSDDPTRT